MAKKKNKEVTAPVEETVTPVVEPTVEETPTEVVEDRPLTAEELKVLEDAAKTKLKSLYSAK